MKKKLTQRQHYMLYLISQESPMEVSELARRLDVSKRTIQRDFVTLQDYLQSYGVALDLRGGQISLHGTPEQLDAVFSDIGKLPTQVALTPQDRAFFIAIELLLTDGTLKLSYLARRLHVTSASVSHDLGQVSDWLLARGLQLIRRRGYGVEVRGEEHLRLEAIAELVHEQIPMSDLMATLHNQSGAQGADETKSWLETWMGRDRLRQIRSVLTKELKTLNPPLDEAAFYDFMLHVVLTCIRVEGSAQLAVTDSVSANAADMALCRRILQRLLPSASSIEGEAQYLAKHLRGAKVLMTEESRMLPLNMTAMELAFHLATRLSELLRLPLTKDRQLILGLAQHLEPAMYRMKTGLIIRNPLLQEIILRYGDLYEAMKRASREVIEPYGLLVPDAEVGYLTMHLGAALERFKAGTTWRTKIVCPNGISSAELLASRIRNEFPQVTVVGTESIQELTDEGCDFIVSTVPIGKRDRPTITVSPFLNTDDIAGVQRILSGLQQQVEPFVSTLSEPSPRQPLQEDSIAGEMARTAEVIHTSANTVGQLIYEIAQRLVRIGAASDLTAIQTAIENRERQGSIVLPGKRFAVLHARAATLTRCHISIYRCHEPIRMLGVGKSDEPVDCFLVLLARPDEPDVHVAMLGKLSSALVMEPDIVDVLRNAGTDEIQERILTAMIQTQE